MASGDALRRMYAGGRPNRLARVMNRIGSALNDLGLFPHWSVTLETVGPKTGKPLSLPVVIATYDHREFLVSMLGQGSRWVHNVRSADGRATLRAGRRRHVLLADVPVEERAPILRAYLAQAPGARPHIPVDRREPVASFEAIAADYPVFEILDDPRVTFSSRRSKMGHGAEHTWRRTTRS